MRLILGIILGVILTIGGAYVADSTQPTTAGAQQRPMVNWDVVGKNFNELATRAREQWNKLAG